mmetsp:Transcript_7653/g.11366  ORF Transcript_7653/g.11366 Transcript_7653/m.11366 type:complete len:763 (+) Transcript_7653:91-2379(+)
MKKVIPNLRRGISTRDAKWKEKCIKKMENSKYFKKNNTTTYLMNGTNKKLMDRWVMQLEEKASWKKAYQSGKQLTRMLAGYQQNTWKIQQEQNISRLYSKKKEENENVETRVRHLAMAPRNKKLLRKMEKKANAPNASIHLQERYMEELANHYPQDAVKRYESYKYPITPNITEHYIFALQKIAGVQDEKTRAEKKKLKREKEDEKRGQPFIDGESGYSFRDWVHYLVGDAVAKNTATMQPPKLYRLPWYVTFILYAVMVVLGFMLSNRFNRGKKKKNDNEHEESETKDDGAEGLLGATFGNSGMKIRMVKNTNKSFDDVKGIDECKQELEEIVEFLKNPTKYQQMGARLPRGILLMGEPGCGKTLLAKAVATEAGVPFLSVAGSEFEQVFVGVGASRIRKLFQQAKSYKKPVLIFIDEIDSIARRRFTSNQMDDSQTLNEFLTQMDGFGKNDAIIVIAATNSSTQELDPALMRPGRFDRIVNVPLPDTNGRKDLIQYYLSSKEHDEKMNLSEMSRMMRGFTGAEIENCLNSAAIHAVKCKRNKVVMEDIDFAVDRQRMGVELKSRKVEQEDRELTAYHEAGHAMVQYLLQSSNPDSNMKVHKITIIPRGPAGGYTSFVPLTDVQATPITQLQDQIRVAMGGTVAEELLYGEDYISGGAAGDLRQATNIAFYMATRGLTDRGVTFYDPEKASEKSKQSVDAMTDEILKSAKNDVRYLLKQHRKDLDVIAKNLLEYDTISGEEMIAILKGKKIRTQEGNEMIF